MDPGCSGQTGDICAIIYDHAHMSRGKAHDFFRFPQEGARTATFMTQLNELRPSVDECFCQEHHVPKGGIGHRIQAGQLFHASTGLASVCICSRKLV